MLGDFLLSFFLGMPAIVAVIKGREMKSPVARVILVQGGLVAVVLISLVILPMLACDGTLLATYSNCLGGEAVTSLAARGQPLMIVAGKIYVLLGIPLALFAFAIEGLGLKSKGA
ncbi:hypothetical protein [Roseovarius sp. 2305UL8-3]|uniref:hypothetical protein n=1 Tax=Roseovarius conchicola TaxID=3121636 RepID=UPI00352821FE